MRAAARRDVRQSFRRRRRRRASQSAHTPPRLVGEVRLLRVSGHLPRRALGKATRAKAVSQRGETELHVLDTRHDEGYPAEMRAPTQPRRGANPPWATPPGLAGTRRSGLDKPDATPRRCFQHMGCELSAVPMLHVKRPGWDARDMVPWASHHRTRQSGVHGIGDQAKSAEPWMAASNSYQRTNNIMAEFLVARHCCTPE